MLSTEKDCLFIGSYFPPEKAKYYEDTDKYNGVTMLEDCMLELTDHFGDLAYL